MMDGASSEAFARLIARLAAGDAAAETELIQRFQRGVRIAAGRRLGRYQALAEDIAQETMARILERLRQGALREPHRLPGYIHGCMRHVCDRELDRLRQQSGTMPLEIAVSDHVQAIDLESARPGPAELAENAQLHALVRTLLAEMPVPRDGEVLRRFYILQHGAQRICADLGVKHEHLHRLLSRARTRLAALLAQRSSEPGRNGGKGT